MIHHALFRTVLATALALVAFTARAEVRLHHLFTDHMVLQQGTSVPVWGWAEDGEKVTVEFRDQRVSTVARGGRWMVKLGKLRAADGSSVLKVSGDNPARKDRRHSSVAVLDVLVGEVWIASGQSNMEWPLNRSFNSTNDIASAANANIRLFTVPKLKLNAPTNDVNASWQLCEPATAPGFSAVAYYFARDLQKALGVPVGIIHTSWGGSPAEVWIREDLMAADKDWNQDILGKYAADKPKLEAAVAKWEEQRAAAAKEKKPFTARRPSGGWKPAELYNGMIANIIPYAINGAIWYQGESNAGRAWQYRRLFTDMIENWRRDWDRDFTFLEVQLAPFDPGHSLEQIAAAPVESNWAELREAQLLATENLKKVGMAVITDVGDKNDIHPTKKEPVGARLALLARSITYREKIVASGPEFDGAKFKDGKAILSFDSLGGGLEARGGKLTGFAIAGEDKKFVWGDAVIEGDKVVVGSASVAKPVAVRFGWADFPIVNLFNKEGIPATPFRTDDWPMITKPKPQAQPQGK